MPGKSVALIVGSLRKESFNRKMAHALMTLAPKDLNLKIVEINDLQMYNQDFDEDPPAAWTEFRQKLKEHDAIIFVTPEYNRSVPAVLKNAIDIGSRPYGKSVWDGKPAAIISVSPGAMGGFGANHHLRQSLTFLNMPTLQQPEAYIGNASKLFDGEGQLNSDSTREFMQKFLNAFAQWISKNSTGQR